MNTSTCEPGILWGCFVLGVRSELPAVFQLSLHRPILGELQGSSKGFGWFILSELMGNCIENLYS